MLEKVLSVSIRSVELDAQGTDAGASHPDITISGLPTGLWLDSLGCLMVVTDDGSLYQIFTDGSAVRLSRLASGSWGGLSWSVRIPDKPCPVLLGYGANWLESLLPSTQPIGPLTANGQVSMAVLPDRCLCYWLGKVFTGAIGAAMLSTVEAILDAGDGGTGGLIIPAGFHLWWLSLIHI